MQSIVISGKYMIDHNEESGLIYNIGDACVYKISVNTAKRLEEQAIQSRDNAESLITEINHLTINNSPSYITTSTYKNIFSSQSTGRLNKLTIIVNNLCNLNCKYCYANGGDYDRPVSIMNSADAKQYLDALLEQGITEIKIINFFGGEPLLNPETINFIGSSGVMVGEKCHHPQHLC